MAKKKEIDAPIEEMAEEVVEEVVEETTEPVEEVKEQKVDVEAFINRKLYAINDMENKALAKVLAERVISNRKAR